MSSRHVGRLMLRIAAALLFLLPLYWLAAAALVPPGSPLPQTWQFWPDNATLANFSRLNSLLPMTRFTLNSLQVVAIAVPLTLITSSWAGFGMSQLPGRSQRRWVLLSLTVLLVPGIALWSARFFIYRLLGWHDSILALIAPAWMGSSPFYVLMFYRAFRRVPAAVFEAARLEGAGVLRTWLQVALPIARPTAAAVSLLSFILYWGDFISPLLYLRGESNFTLPVALQTVQQMSRSDWPLMMAAALWAAAIPLALFLLAQPYFASIIRRTEH